MFLEYLARTLRGTWRILSIVYRKSLSVQNVRYVEGAFLFFRHVDFVDAVGGFDEGLSFFFFFRNKMPDLPDKIAKYTL